MAIDPNDINVNINVTDSNWTQSVDQNTNYIAPSQFLFTMSSVKNVSYYCQTANIPAVNLGQAQMNTRVKDIAVPGDKVTFGDLIITFLVDENMSNYKELFEWIKKIGTAEDTDDYMRYIREQAYKHPTSAYTKPTPMAPTMTDATLSILSSSNNVTNEIKFYNLFPISLEGLQFDTTDTAYTYLTASASFHFSHYEIIGRNS
jgi:hypothetical protein